MNNKHCDGTKNEESWHIRRLHDYIFNNMYINHFPSKKSRKSWRHPIIVDSLWKLQVSTFNSKDFEILTSLAYKWVLLTIFNVKKFCEKHKILSISINLYSCWLIFRPFVCGGVQRSKLLPHCNKIYALIDNHFL